MAYIFHTDPGHGWLQVTADDLKSVGLKPTDFSRYSYRDRKRFFLEEDCDASKFVRTYEAKFGAKPQFTDQYSDRSFIRNLPSIY